jgi:UDP-glucuronate 4-epimerase
MKRGTTMHVLITGGAGFIGSHLAEKLSSLTHPLTMIDNLDPYYEPKQKLDHLDELEKEGVSFAFLKGDILDIDFCKKLFQENQFDAVIHLAALPGVPFSIEQPELYIDVDIKGTVNALKFAGEAGVKHVIFASSSSVYGNQGNVPLKEEFADGKVVSPYAAAKYSGEAFCQAYQQLYGFQLTILRFFTVYGPWGRPDMAIPKFIRKLLKGETIEVFGKGLSRDFTYVDDIVNGITQALHTSEGNQIYNLGCGQPVAMEVLLDHLFKRFPDAKVIRKPMRKGDVVMTWSDISKARSLLGYKPTVEIEEGLDRTILWAKKYFGA